MRPELKTLLRQIPNRIWVQSSFDRLSMPVELSYNDMVGFAKKEASHSLAEKIREKMIWSLDFRGEVHDTYGSMCWMFNEDELEELLQKVFELGQQDGLKSYRTPKIY